MKTKDKIILCSIELFNRDGVVAVTTNHIAKEMNISPGNLYFHYRNKEEIIRQIFRMMALETYAIGRTKKGQTPMHPLEILDKNYDIYWKYRFFHREMYYLRRKDPQLARAWKSHIAKVHKMMVLLYKRWIREGWMNMIQNPVETEFTATVLLATASNFLQTFESTEHVPAKQHVLTGKKYVAWLLLPHTLEPMRSEFQKFIFQ
jgi:AcrR family transcriptional regulator